MKIISTIMTIIAVLVTVAGASAMNFQYRSISSAPFSGDGYSSMSIGETGVGSYSLSTTPYGGAGGWSVRGSSGGFGYDTSGLRSFGVNSRDVSGSWNRGYSDPYSTASNYGSNYGGFAVGNARFRGTMYNSVNMYGDAWGSQSVYASPYSSGWGSRSTFGNGYS